MTERRLTRTGDVAAPLHSPLRCWSCAT